MTGPQFFQTIMGNRFFEGQLPTLIKNLGVIGNELKRMNDLKEGIVKEKETDTEKQFWEGKHED